MTNRHRLMQVVLVTALVAAGATVPEAQQARRDAIPRLAFEKYRLGNGLEVVLHQNRRLPIVAVNLWYHVGPANEAAGRTGFAHLFEHMMFQGSKHVGDDEHLRLLEGAGASDLNASTGFDRTNYYQTVPAHQLELPLWLESDRMGYLLDKLDQAALANQQDVVRNERRQRTENTPYGLAQEALYQLVFPKGHPYHGVIIGSHADIQAATLQDVRAFFRQYYAPNNATLVIAGDFETADARRLVDKYFATLRRGAPVPPVKATTPPITSERRQVVPARVELPRVMMAWLTPPLFRPGDADADVAATILGGGPSSRLYKRLVYERQIAQSVQVSQGSMAIQSVFIIDAVARPGHTADELEKAITEEVAALAAAPPDAAEIERARNTIVTGLVGSIESISGLAERLNSYNHYVGTPDYLQRDVQRYRDVTAAKVQAFVRGSLKPGARAVVHAVPGEPPPLPPEPAPTPVPSPGPGAPEGAAQNRDEPWRNERPKPGAAKAVQLPVPQTATLPNGLTLVLSERRGVPIVSASLVVKTGGDANPADKPGLAGYTASLLDQGTTTRTALQIADEVARLGGALAAGSDMDATSVDASAMTSNVPALLDLVADVSLRPAFPEAEVERQRARRLASLLQARDNPARIADNVMVAAMYGTMHPYGFDLTGTEASVKATTRDDLMAFWRQHFVPGNAALVVAGDLTMPELRTIAGKAFGGWARGDAAARPLPPPSATQARVIIVDRPSSPQTELRVATPGAARSSPDYRPAQVMNLAFGGLFGSRINMNLREQHGYTYGARSQFIFRKVAGHFRVSTAVRTEVTGPAVEEIFAEVRALPSRPLTEAELSSAKEGLTQSLPGDFETSASAVDNYAAVFIYELGLDYFTRFAASVAQVTTAQAAEMAAKYLVPEKMTVIAVGDRSIVEPQLRKLGLGTVEIRRSDGTLAAP